MIQSLIGLAKRIKVYFNFILINKVLQKNKQISVYKLICPVTHLSIYTLRDRVNEVKGASIGFDKKLALIKAWGEYVERYFLKSYAKSKKISINSSGFAAHTSLSSGKKSALYELIERDSFTISWLLNIPAVEVDLLRYLKNSPQHKNVYKKVIRQYANKIYFVEFPSCMGVRVLGCFVFNQYFHMDLSADENIELAARSVLELSIKHITYEKNLKQKSKIVQFSEKPQPIENKYINLTLKKAPFLKKWLVKSERVMDLPDFSYSFENLTTEHSFLKNTGFKVVRCISEDCQKIWFGNTKEEYINHSRIEAVRKKYKKFMDKKLNLDPHPMP